MIDLDAMNKDPWPTWPVDKKNIRYLVGEVKRLRAALRRISHAPHGKVYCADGHEEAVLIARAALEGERAVTGWQPIDTAPKTKKRILAIKNKTIKIVVYYPFLKEWGYPQEWGGDGTWKPTHWMPLPAPPKAREKADD
jgi:hypothetical protein